MAQDDGNALPLLDQAVLDRLRTELDDDEGVLSVFVRNFIVYLPHRTEKLRLTLTTGDLTGALDAILSLRTSSQMVGAERLARFAWDLEQSLRIDARNNEPDIVLPRLAVANLGIIIRCGRQTTFLLLKYLRLS